MRQARELCVLILAVAAALLAGFGAGVQQSRTDDAPAFCPIGAPAAQHSAGTATHSTVGPQLARR